MFVCNCCWEQLTLYKPEGDVGLVVASVSSVVDDGGRRVVVGLGGPEVVLGGLYPPKMGSMRRIKGYGPPEDWHRFRKSSRSIFQTMAPPNLLSRINSSWNRRRKDINAWVWNVDNFQNYIKNKVGDLSCCLILGLTNLYLFRITTLNRSLVESGFLFPVLQSKYA